MHLPVFAAAAGGLFADHDVDVELVDGRGSTTERIAAGEAEFGLTAALYYLRAQAGQSTRLAARFVMAFHQRDPIAGLVRDDSDIREPTELAGCTAARWQLGWMMEAYTAGLQRLGVAPPPTVVVEGDPSQALLDRTVDVVPTWAETIPVRSYAGVAVRSVPLGGQAYASGLVAADAVDDDIVRRVRAAITAGFHLQRERPEVGVAAFHAHYPDIPGQDVRDNWEYFEPFAFPDATTLPGSLDRARWWTTVEQITEVHRLGSVPSEDGYRDPASTPPPEQTRCSSPHPTCR